jgi:hypothetical protein
MSVIHGEGYGDKHNWENKGTEQNYNQDYRNTLFICKDCDQYFRHYYHITPDIFDQIKISGITKECVKKDKYKESE